MKTKKSATSRTSTKLSDPKKQYKDMTADEREFLRKKHKVMRDILNLTPSQESIGSSVDLTDVER